MEDPGDEDDDRETEDDIDEPDLIFGPMTQEDFDALLESEKEKPDCGDCDLEFRIRQLANFSLQGAIALTTPATQENKLVVVHPIKGIITAKGGRGCLSSEPVTRQISRRPRAVTIRRLVALAKFLVARMTKQGGMFMAIRTLYYLRTEVFGSVAILDKCIWALAKILNWPRRYLGLTTECKGLVCGAGITIVLNSGKELVVSMNGIRIPMIDTYKVIYVDVRKFVWVLIVESKSAYLELEPLVRALKGKVIMITGRGVPCLGTRRFVKMLFDACKKKKSKVKFRTLTDPNPWGLWIAWLYKRGALMSPGDPDRLDAVGSELQHMGMGIDTLSSGKVALKGLNGADKKKIEYLKRVLSPDEDKDLWDELMRFDDIPKKGELEQVPGGLIAHLKAKLAL